MFPSLAPDRLRDFLSHTDDASHFDSINNRHSQNKREYTIFISHSFNHSPFSVSWSSPQNFLDDSQFFHYEKERIVVDMLLVVGQGDCFQLNGRRWAQEMWLFKQRRVQTWRSCGVVRTRCHRRRRALIWVGRWICYIACRKVKLEIVCCLFPYVCGFTLRIVIDPWEAIRRPYLTEENRSPDEKERKFYCS